MSQSTPQIGPGKLFVSIPNTWCPGSKFPSYGNRQGFRQGTAQHTPKTHSVVEVLLDSQ